MLPFIIPAIVLTAGVFLVPLGYIVVFSLVHDGHTTWRAFDFLMKSEIFRSVLLNTAEISITATLLSVTMAYPIAMHLARQSPRRRAIYMAMVLLPFWTSILVKSYAFTLLLGRTGVINNAIRYVFGDDAVLPLLYNRTGVLIGMANFLVPFSVFPILSNLLAQDSNLVKAARSMGAGSFKAWWRITLPLSLPAVAAGALLSLVISFGFFVTPALLGGRKDLMLANLIDLFTRETLDWNIASAIAVLLLALSGILIAALSRVPGAVATFGRSVP